MVESLAADGWGSRLRGLVAAQDRNLSEALTGRIPPVHLTTFFSYCRQSLISASQLVFYA